MSHWTEKTFLERPEVFARSMHHRVEDAPEEIEQLLSLVRSAGVEPDSALDVACGIGRHAVELARSGPTVWGVDLSPDYVDRARERAADAGVEDRTTFEVGDMRDLGELDGEYDLVVNLWTSFGFFDDDTNEAVAAGLRARTAEEGALVMEMANKEHLLANFSASSVAWEGDGLYVEQTDYDPETSRVETDVTAFRELEDGYEYVGEVSWDLRTYAPAELRRLLLRAGFSTVNCYAGLDGEQLDRESSRLVVLARP